MGSLSLAEMRVALLLTLCAVAAGAPGTPSIFDITAVIKTFHRPACLQNLLESMHTHAPGLKAIVVDDGRDAVLNKRLADSPVVLKYLVADFDTGISASRNLAINQVTTSYVLLLDDDFEFTEDTQVTALAKVAQSVDGIAGGELFVIPDKGMPAIPFMSQSEKPQPVSSALLLSLREGRLISQPERQIHRGTGCVQATMVSNFLVAKTSLLKTIGWDEKLKLSEAEDFFLRADQKRVAVMYCAHIKAKHDGRCVESEGQDHQSYGRSRQRGLYFKGIFFDKWNIQHYAAPMGGTYFRTCAFGPCTVAHMWKQTEIQTCDQGGTCVIHKVKVEGNKLHKCDERGKCEVVKT